MPYAITHILLTIILVDLYRDHITKHKKNFPMFTLLIAGIAGILPDIDVVICAILKYLGYAPMLLQHGGFFHTPFFGLIFLIPAFFFIRKRNYKVSTAFFVITFAILFHIFLDLLLGGGYYEGIMLFWPVSIVKFKIFLFNSSGIDFWAEGLDTVIFLLWIWHEEIKHKIKDFI